MTSGEPDAQVIGELAAADTALAAWRRFGGRTPSSVKPSVLKHKPKTLLLRLPQCGDGNGRGVIAKRAATHSIEKEAMIHIEILASLGISSVRCYGTIGDDDPSLSWLFMEDAGEKHLIPNHVPHRALLTRWLAEMNIAASGHAVVRSVSERSFGWYLEQLVIARDRIIHARETRGLASEHRQLLGDIVAQFDAVQFHGREMFAFCDTMPRTLVHGDIAPKNLIVREHRGKLSLFLIDWETAAHTVAATDLAYHIDLNGYHAIAAAEWPRLSLSDWERLSLYGRIFRVTTAIECASHYLAHDVIDTEIKYFGAYRSQLAEAFVELSWPITSFAERRT